MSEGEDFNTGMARIQALTRQLEKSADPSVRVSVKELVQCMMNYHGAAINRMMEVVDQTSPSVIDSLGDDPLVRSLLVLYGLHPQDAKTRVKRALEELAPMFRKHSADVELEWVQDSVVRLRIGDVPNSRVGRMLKESIEEQIYAYAPDVTRVEGLTVLGASELVGIEALS